LRTFTYILVKLFSNMVEIKEGYGSIKQINMQGEVFGWVSDSSRFTNAVKTAFNVRR
jgi:hypothetical protein